MDFIEELEKVEIELIDPDEYLAQRNQWHPKERHREEIDRSYFYGILRNPIYSTLEGYKGFGEIITSFNDTKYPFGDEIRYFKKFWLKAFHRFLNEELIDEISRIAERNVETREKIRLEFNIFNKKQRMKLEKEGPRAKRLSISFTEENSLIVGYQMYVPFEYWQFVSLSNLPNANRAIKAILPLEEVSKLLE